MRKQLLLIIITAVIIVIAIMQPDGVNKEETARINFQAPSFELSGLNDATYSLASLKGKPVLINFWASWCGPCRKEAPELVRLYDKYKSEIEIYAVNLTSDDSLKGAIAFSKRYQFSFPVLLDEQGEVSKLYKVRSIPTTYFIDGSGKIMNVVTGAVSPETLEKLILEIIKSSRREEK
ncbi:TlpA family protein disulfide reductase [Paenibacillus alkaliterrae]|uniref:TlpA family protein disulfide reductase n=1 Tax=Paenibacillus alkaliterrae TaxID=320909 RepID=UPI001F34929E|nr:TlpA disulfide reductase family protein [Paenibacillus alkaliterrae]MCF2941458.1 TlpA family protein disulfide reductase [Paenibacillus alkaliterrae]